MGFSMAKKEDDQSASSTQKFGPDDQLLEDDDLNVIGASQPPAENPDPFGNGATSGSSEEHTPTTNAVPADENHTSGTDSTDSDDSADKRHAPDAPAEGHSHANEPGSALPASSGQDSAPETTTNIPLTEQSMQTPATPQSAPESPTLAASNGSVEKLLLAGPQETEDLWMNFIEGNRQLSYHQAEMIRLLAGMTPETMNAVLTRSRYLLDRMERLGPRVLQTA